MMEIILAYGFFAIVFGTLFVGIVVTALTVFNLIVPKSYKWRHLRIVAQILLVLGTIVLSYMGYNIWSQSLYQEAIYKNDKKNEAALQNVQTFYKTLQNRLSKINLEIPGLLSSEVSEVRSNECYTKGCYGIVFFHFKARPANIEEILTKYTREFDTLKHETGNLEYLEIRVRSVVNGEPFYQCKPFGSIITCCEEDKFNIAEKPGVNYCSFYEVDD